MAGLLTASTYSRFEAAAKIALSLAGQQQAGTDRLLTGVQDSVGGEGGTDDMYPHAFDVSVTDPDYASVVRVFLPATLNGKFYDLSADVGAPLGAALANQNAYKTGVWCRAFGARTATGSGNTDSVYFIADFSANLHTLEPINDERDGRVPSAFVVLPTTLGPDTGFVSMTVVPPPWVLAIEVARITTDGEVFHMPLEGVSFEMPNPQQHQIATGYGLRLTEEDFTAAIEHAVCAWNPDNTETAFAGTLLLKVNHNADIRTFIYLRGLVSVTQAEITDLLGNFDPTGASERDVEYATDLTSSTVAEVPDYASINVNWLGVNALAADATCVAICRDTSTVVASPFLLVFSGLLNTLPDEAYEVDATTQAVSKVFQRNLSATFVYSYSQIVAAAATTSPANVSAENARAYVIQNTASQTVATLSLAAAGTPDHDTGFPTTLLDVNMHGLSGVVNSYNDMEFFGSFSLRTAVSAVPPPPWTPEDPMPADTLAMTPCTGDAASIDFNDNAKQKSVRFPTGDPDTAVLSGCGALVRLPVAPPDEECTLGVSFKTDAVTTDREYALKGITEAPASEADNQRVYGIASDDSWGMFKLEQLFQFDDTAKQFYLSPDKEIGAESTVVMLRPAENTATFDFASMRTTKTCVVLRVVTNVKMVGNNLVRSYRDVLIPKMFLAEVTAETDETIVEGYVCPA